MRAQLELLIARVEKLEKVSDTRLRNDVDGVKRDMVRVAAMAERGGAVKDHLNRLSRRIDELEGGAEGRNDVAALEGRLSRVARESEDKRDRLDARVQRIEDALSQLTEQLAHVVTRVDALAAARSEETRARTPARRAAPKAAPTSGDDLRRIKGIGPKYDEALRAAGVETWAQIAAWTDEDVQRIADTLGIKRARIDKAGWVEKARALSADD